MHMPSTGSGVSSYRRHLTTPRTDTQPAVRARPMMRRYSISHLAANGDICDLQKVAPALPLFESGFSAFARGTLITTDFGMCAVEDLLPGMRVLTGENEYLPLLWRGNMTLIPNVPVPHAEQQFLTRISADSFGLGRPGSDLLLGPSARVVQRNTRIAAAAGAEVISIPAEKLLDGESAIRLNPVASVEVYHLAFENQTSVWANGLECETFHPGTRAIASLSQEMAPVFLSMFPHVETFDDFGPLAIARPASSDMDGISAA